jgi:hypothetical protein
MWNSEGTQLTATWTGEGKMEKQGAARIRGKERIPAKPECDGQWGSESGSVAGKCQECFPPKQQRETVGAPPLEEAERACSNRQAGEAVAKKDGRGPEERRKTRERASDERSCPQQKDSEKREKTRWKGTSNRVTPTPDQRAHHQHRERKTDTTGSGHLPKQPTISGVREPRRPHRGIVLAALR